MSLTDRLESLRLPLQIDQLRQEVETLRAATEAADFWSDQENAVAVSSRLAAANETLTVFDDLSAFALMQQDMSEPEVADLEKQIAALELRALLNGPHDACGAILTIHAGTGGTDAQDWAEMLERMFLRFVESGSTEAPEDRILATNRKNWSAEMLDEVRGEEAGIKRAVIRIRGQAVFGLLRSEVGVHRLVRQSPFNAKGLRQTSFALVEVLPELPESEMPAINPADLSIDVFRSGGAGGQHVNTTDSAVRITHKPSGIVVVVQNERSQHQNKASAMAILASRLQMLQEKNAAEEKAILRGEFKEGTWGNQIRSYVLHPYQMVKDHRTDAETSDTTGVLGGDLKLFIESYLKFRPTED